MSRAEKKPGYLVEHDDGRRGIAYHSDQKRRFRKQGKMVVQFTDEEFRPVGRKKAIKKTRLTIKGFAD